eukprot:365378-Chlamydomonas_euryale.AAC.7
MAIAAIINELMELVEVELEKGVSISIYQGYCALEQQGLCLSRVAHLLDLRQGGPTVRLTNCVTWAWGQDRPYHAILMQGFSGYLIDYVLLLLDGVVNSMK